jgi:hypothetical protein
MKHNFRIFILSLFLAFLMVSIFSFLGGEISTLGLFPGFMLNWFIEQLLIEIRNEPYFMLGNYSAILNLIFYFTLLFLSLKFLLIILNASRKNESLVLK